jgi:HAD superfamily hydrolase (TIGR01459 family)
MENEVVRPLESAFVETPAGLRALAAGYDGFIVDLWGVLHDGFKPFPGVVEALEQLMAAGKRIVILSNAPRRVADVVKRMTEIGIRPGLYHHVMSSGEESWQHLAKRDDPFYRALGRIVYHIGPPRDDGMLAELGLIRAAGIDDAEFILNTGPWGWEENAALYEEVLQKGSRRDVPMVCANPDLVVHHGGRLAICAGTLAQRYETLGGRVRWHGKPYPSVYRTCFELLGPAIAKERVLAVGDSLRTDIAGANGVGIKSLLITGGIHAEEFGGAEGEIVDSERRARAMLQYGSAPTYEMRRFVW